MARNYKLCNINDSHHDCEKRMFLNTNNILVNNFNKVAAWIAKEFPKLSGTFQCRHNPYHWVALVVEEGKAYLEEGSHGYGFDTALSTTETAVFSRGSMQRIPYAFDGVQFFRNDRLEEFLLQWPTIKTRIIAECNAKDTVYSESFTA